MGNVTSLCIPIAELGGFPAVANRFNVEAFNDIGYRRWFRREEHIVNDMLLYSKDGIRFPLLKSSLEDSSCDPTEMFEWILEYMGLTANDISTVNPARLARKLINEGLKVSTCRDEIYFQIIKQTRRNPNPESKTRAWELLHLVSSTMPPSKNFVQLITDYIQLVFNSEVEEQLVKEIAIKSWVSLECTLQSGPKKSLPSCTEIENLLACQSLTCIVFFLDETFEELTYEMTTTVSEAMKQLADIIKLQNYQTFTLFECRKMTGARRIEDTCDEHIMLDDNKYIADVLFDFKNSKSSRDGVQSKLLVKKKLFEETDEAISEFQFVNLSFVQAQYDYLLGNYPVVKEDAAQLCALQALAEHGSVIFYKKDELRHTLREYIPKHALGNYTPEGWLQAVTSWSQVHGQSSKEKARLRFLKILSNLRYGRSSFFPVNKMEDSIGLFPDKLVLGINKRGIHFFAPSPRDYLSSSEFRDLMHFRSSNSAVFFKIRVEGVLRSFQFETRHGEHICLALRTYSSNLITRKSSKSKAATQSNASTHRESIGGSEECRADGEEQGSNALQSNGFPVARSQNMLLGTSQGNTIKKSREDDNAQYDLQLNGKETKIELQRRISEMNSLFESERNEVERVLHEFVEYASRPETVKALERDWRSSIEEMDKESDLAFSLKVDCMRGLSNEDLVEKVKQVMDICGPLKSGAIEELKDCERLEFEKELKEQKRCIDKLDTQLSAVRSSRKECSATLEEQNGKIRTLVCLKSPDPDEEQSKIMTVEEDTICFPQDETDGVESVLLVDAVFAPGTSTEEIFDSVKGMCANALQGYNVYFVNIGTRRSEEKKTMLKTYVDSGFIITAVDEICRLRASDYKHCDVSLEWSMMVLQNDQLTDLLATDHKKLVVKHDLRGLVHVVNLEFQKFESSALLNDRINDTLERQNHIGHDTSSSSFFVTINIRCVDSERGTLRQGRMVFSDLVACHKKCSSFNAVRKVVEALRDNASNVPYTACTLTKLLSDCLGGNAKTLVMTHVNPQDDIRGVLEMLTSLREIRNVVSKREMNKQVIELKKKLDEEKGRKRVPDWLLDAIDMLDVTNEPPEQKLRNIAKRGPLYRS